VLFYGLNSFFYNASILTSQHTAKPLPKIGTPTGLNFKQKGPSSLQPKFKRKGRYWMRCHAFPIDVLFKFSFKNLAVF
jgi:hypothetical protein